MRVGGALRELFREIRKILFQIPPTYTEKRSALASLSLTSFFPGARAHRKVGTSSLCEERESARSASLTVSKVKERRAKRERAGHKRVTQIATAPLLGRQAVRERKKRMLLSTIEVTKPSPLFSRMCVYVRER